ncbi:peptidoglycan-binding lysin domain-containingprotein [Purpureocillium lavendulum]|uniref:Peptidoglycan-binding lysin domain-containingprotein n=1 Tax=Purpureocillium lavendulum TaxID=1247861 RepID=A0AB34G4Y0_9HYPO|nr:peptidoglycan-binding lysin domain-containingprotein [Purpureocillium lavendulum]
MWQMHPSPPAPASLLPSSSPRPSLTDARQDNPRFARYCPYCQVSTAPSPLPQRLRDPPSYTAVPSTRATTAQVSTAPPPYTLELPDEKTAAASDDEKQGPAAQDTLHFLDHDHDSIASLSLRYGVPAAALRRTNNIASDHLLVGRKTVLIPGEYYRAGVSLSPRPVEGEDEELRKSKIRRFMTSCKVADYDVALLYLEQSAYDLGDAIEAYRDDEAWERNHPMQRSGKAGPVQKGLRNRGPFWRGL